MSVYPSLDFYYPTHKHLGVVQPGEFFLEIRLATSGVEACGEDAGLFTTGELLGYFTPLASGVRVYSHDGRQMGEAPSKLVAAQTILGLRRAQKRTQVLAQAS